MDKKLQIVERVYGEGANHVPIDQIVEDDAGLRQEFSDMSAIRGAIDDLPGRSPDSATVDDIVAMAAAEWKKPKPRSGLRLLNLPPALYTSSTTWKFAVAASIVLLAVVVTVPLMRSTPTGQASLGEETKADLADTRAQEVGADDEFVAAAPAPTEAPEGEAQFRPSQQSGRRDAARARSEFAAEPAPNLASSGTNFDADASDRPLARANEELASSEVDQLSGNAERSGVVGDDLADSDGETLRLWDDIDDIRRIHGRIEALHASSVDLEWGEPALPLELLTGGPASAGPRPQTVGSRRQ